MNHCGTLKLKIYFNSFNRMIKSLIKNTPRCLKHLEPLVVLAVLGLLALCEANKEVATNSFYVKINGKDGAEAAHKIARRNGFHNVGPVSFII